MADDEAVLAEPGARHRERGEVGVRARDVDREAERDRGGARVLLEDLDLDARRAAPRSIGTRGGRRPLGQRGRARARSARISSSGASPLRPTRQVRPRVVCLRELPSRRRA